ncbi:MAG: hypothetical protein AAF587_32925 [Bacteroidota bacterium]
MYTDYLKEKFPHDEKNGMFKAPKLPAVKLGKILIRDTRISSPNDVIAMHHNSGTFSSSVVLLTKDSLFYDGGAFLFEDIKEVQLKGKKLTVFANQQTQMVPHSFSVKNEQVGKTLQRILDGMTRFDPVTDKLFEESSTSNSYEQYSTTELDWLNLRDEIMRTIDMLYDRYNDGKLSLLEYEDKKEELLRRL